MIDKIYMDGKRARFETMSFSIDTKLLILDGREYPIVVYDLKLTPKGVFEYRFITVQDYKHRFLKGLFPVGPLQYAERFLCQMYGKFKDKLT